MELREFGNTGLKVSVIGLGAGQVGSADLSEADAERLLHGVLDAGLNLVDTARSYGLSEQRIGRHLADRREQYVLSSKCGYGVAGVDDWTADAVTRGVDEALTKLRTDYIDIMHLHSCSRAVLERGDVLTALTAAQRAGKIRVAAYSGENDALEFAVKSGVFGSVQTSVNICDQRSLHAYLPAAAQRGLGVIAKRPLANAFWRHAERPIGDYCDEYWQRAKTLRLSPGELPWGEFAARFAAHTLGVHTIIVGTSKLDHFQAAVAAVRRGPLPETMTLALHADFEPHAAAWTGQV